MLVDISLEQVIDSHNLNDNAVTLVLKELDLQSQKTKAQKGEVETYDIFGLSEWSADSDRAADLTSGKALMQRLLFKSNSVENQNMPLYVKPSLLRK